jgi:hypothetical protein
MMGSKKNKGKEDSEGGPSRGGSKSSKGGPGFRNRGGSQASMKNVNSLKVNP